MSKDGSTIATVYGSIWKPGQSFQPLQGLGSYGYIYSISENASFIGGTFEYPDGPESFLWNESSGYETLNGIYYPTAVTATGDKVGGMSENIQPAVWERGKGVTTLSSISYGHITGLSKDGRVAIGNNLDNKQFFLWSNETGIVSPGVPSNYEQATVWDISADGSIVGGRLEFGLRTRPFYWNEQDGYILLDYLDPSFLKGAVTGINHDGSLIVGYNAPDYRHIEEEIAFIWDAQNGVRNLQAVLENDFGLNLDGWTLTTAIGLSEDGTTIFGRGIDPDGNFDFWVAEIPEPATLSLLALGGLALLRKRK